MEKKDMVVKPEHYNVFTQEVIDTIGDWVKGYKDPYIGYLMGTVLKYLSRAPYKHDTPFEDLQKALFYYTKLINYLVDKGDMNKQDVQKVLSQTMTKVFE